LTFIIIIVIGGVEADCVDYLIVGICAIGYLECGPGTLLLCGQLLLNTHYYCVCGHLDYYYYYYYYCVYIIIIIIIERLLLWLLLVVIVPVIVVGYCLLLLCCLLLIVIIVI